MNKNLDSTLVISKFLTLARTGEARIEREQIVGRCSRESLELRHAKDICEDFANCGESPNDILRFTKNYGPLIGESRRGEAFRFDLSEWRKIHAAFRENWRDTFASNWQPLGSEKSLSPDAKCYVSRRIDLRRAPWGRLELGFDWQGTGFLETDSLLTLLNICFVAIPYERVRVCSSPNCKFPFFVAHHLKQTFCGTQRCIEWGQRKLKLEYWNRNKKQLLAKRKQKLKGARRGTKKTR